MKLRQKAKRYKKLYENMLKKPCPVIYKTYNGKHYRACCKVNRMELADIPPHTLKNSIENHILEELRPLIWDNLKVENDLYTDGLIRYLDVWM